jgi:hypothetical protein
MGTQGAAWTGNPEFAAAAPPLTPSGALPGTLVLRMESTKAVACSTPARPSTGFQLGMPLAGTPSRIAAMEPGRVRQIRSDLPLAGRFVAGHAVSGEHFFAER